MLTAETLRTDLLDLWSRGAAPIRAILMVTHNIEEAVLMSDRILLDVVKSPGRITAEIKVELPSHASATIPSFRPSSTTSRANDGEGDAATRRWSRGTGIGMVLPRVPSNALSGLWRCWRSAQSGPCRLPVLAEALQMTATIAQTRRGTATPAPPRSPKVTSPTEAGRRFAESAVDERKALFRQHLLTHVPIVAHIKRVLDDGPRIVRRCCGSRTSSRTTWLTTTPRPPRARSSHWPGMARSLPMTKYWHLQSREPDVRTAVQLGLDPVAIIFR